MIPNYQKSRSIPFTKQEFIKRLSKYSSVFNMRANEQIEEIVVMNNSIVIKVAPKVSKKQY